VQLAPPLEPVDWLVLFLPATYARHLPWWWRFAVRFMDPRFGHVILVAILPEADVWLLMDMQFGGLQVRALPLTVTCARLLQEYPTATTYCVVRRPRYLFPKRALWGCNCVTLAKAVLSLRGLIITPRQLHRRLVALQRAEEQADVAGRDQRAEGSRQSGRRAEEKARSAGHASETAARGSGINSFVRTGETGLGGSAILSRVLGA
jgi:hypothetical protein